MIKFIGLFHQVVIEERLICVEQIDKIDEPNDIVAFSLSWSKTQLSLNAFRPWETRPIKPRFPATELRSGNPPGGAARYPPSLTSK